MVDGYTPDYSTDDGAEAGSDLMVGVIIGMAGFAVLIGLGVAVGVILGQLSKIKKGISS